MENAKVWAQGHARNSEKDGVTVAERASGEDRWGQTKLASLPDHSKDSLLLWMGRGTSGLEQGNNKINTVVILNY